MRSALIVFVLLSMSFSTFAQYKRPYRVAYNPDKKSYLVTNRGDGKVLELDSNYKLNTVITGLTDPRDLVVGTVGGNKGLLVIDNNQIVVYDATGYNKIIAFNVNKFSWSEIEDIEMDPRDPQYFYLSDAGAGRIVKGKVGPPPFYTPSYTTLVDSGLNRPKGLLFNNKGELLVVTDDSNARVVAIDTASGKLTTAFTPGIDSLNSITQDNEGNYFITNWDDSYLYRCDKDFKNLTKLTSYNKPAGMAVNVATDLLIVLCHYCDKMEFHKLHYVEPTAGAAACPGDSFTVDVSITAEGVGSYNSSNAFEVELSNASGKFTNPTTIGKVTTVDKPKSIKCKMPNAAKGSGYKIRIKSTSPEFYSTNYAVSVYSVPDLSSVVNNWSLCKGSTVTLGKDSVVNETYHWSNSNNLSDSAISNPTFTANDTGRFEWMLTAENSIFGCTSQTSVVADVNPDIQLTSLAREVGLCIGKSTPIGVASSPYSFEWTPVTGLTSSKVSNPTFNGSVSQKYQVRVEDKATGCTGADSVSVTVHDRPNITATLDSVSVCSGESVRLQVQSDTGVTYQWLPTNGLSDSTESDPMFTSNASGGFAFLIIATNANNCSKSTSMYVENNALPSGTVDEISGAGNKIEGYQIQVTGDLNGSSYCRLFLVTPGDSTVFIDTFSKLPVVAYKLNSVWQYAGFKQGFLEFVSDSGCTSYSDTVGMPWLSVKNVFVSEIQVYPNPVEHKIHIKSGSLFLTNVSISDINGIVIYNEDVTNGKSSIVVDVADYQNGMYIVYITDEYGLTYQKKIVKMK
jgi:hypothetical protein